MATPAGSDSILVGEGFLSEHYFTTDATRESFHARVVARRKQWDAGEDESPRSRFTAQRNALLSSFATLAEEDAEELRELHSTLLSILGYDRAGLVAKRDGPLTLYQSAGLDAPGLAVIEANRVDTPEDLLAKDDANLVTQFRVDDKTEHTSVARLLSFLFVSDEYKPPFALVLAGPHAVVTERERWPEGRYLAVDLQLICERNDAKKGGEIDRALTCLAADTLAPDADGDIWWSQVLGESVQHTVGVSKDLREGVRLSIEIIANEVVRRRKARGLEPLPDDLAQPLAKQALRFLYRILFLLYAEASPELGVVPSGAPEYEQGYSIDRLRELTLVALPSQRSQHGTHLYESVATLFRLVDQGHRHGDGSADAVNETARVEGLTFRSLRADLFKPEATALIDEVRLGNAALQRVLKHLLLSKEDKRRKGRDRGFISYAELGINQLGAVYEGLMSYTGQFAENDLYEVAKDGNSEKGSWLVPVSRSEGIADKDFVMTTDDATGEPKPVLHEEGNFVFRLAGRERQQSASYYTPEVLTRFTVSQALEELLDQDGRTTTAEEILELTICEPALGSGAFAIEAVRQLAEQYLTRRQAELGAQIDPDDYPGLLQRVKAFIAVNQVYGVDLNATAVELAEISLWLDTMVEGLHAPWFGLHLRRGNSLIGARKAVHRRTQVEDHTWLEAVPTRVPSGSDGEEDEASVDAIAGRVPHFLLPADGWGAAAEVGKEIRGLVPDAVGRLKTWRRSVKAKHTKKQVDRLVELGHRVERLWEIATRRLEIANQQARRDIPLWGRASDPTQIRSVTREQIEDSLADPDGAYRRLRRVLDAWCALWFWPLTEDQVQPPALEQWYDALSMILGGSTVKATAAKVETLFDDATWDDLGVAEYNDRVLANAKSIEEVLAKHPWLTICERIADQQGFFHWELDFASVFAARGGFDLQVGNPPWVRPTGDEEALLAEGDPWWQLKGKVTQERVTARREQTLTLNGIRELVLDGTAEVRCVSDFVGSRPLYPHLKALQPDLYRCFMERTWVNRSGLGVVGLIHPETHFTDEKAGLLRAGTYRRLRRHWQFINELVLFEIDHHVSFGIHVYGRSRDEPQFLTATSLYHPDTVARSLEHDGSGDEPGLKDPDGNWDLRPHKNRILTVDSGMLQTWHDLLESEDVPRLQTRMVYTVNRAAAAVLESLAHQPRVGELGLEFSAGWHEKNDRTRGYFDSEWGRPDTWRDVILQGPHFHVGVPFYKQPNETMANNLDWSTVDLETLPPDAIPVTSYKPRGDRAKYDRDYTHWGDDDEKFIPAREHYRIAWRKMAANTGERTLIPALVPPGTAHIDGVLSLGVPEAGLERLVSALGLMSSLVADFSIRAAPKANIRFSSVERLTWNPCGKLTNELLSLRTLRLNCLTSAYSDVWNEVVSDMTIGDDWAGGIDYPARPLLADATSSWTPDVPLRRASDRRQALVEIDALLALMLGVTADELCTIYRTQFAVLYGYDRNTYYYDTNGRLVPTPVLQLFKQRGITQDATDGLTVEERTHTNPSGNTYVYELPFVTLDREADMRRAYAHFESVLAERGDG
jgi:hypothetical protein